MRLGKWMWGVGFLALTSATGFVLPATASENIQVVTRGRGERADRVRDRGNRPNRTPNRANRPNRTPNRGNRPDRVPDRGSQPVRVPDRNSQPDRMNNGRVNLPDRMHNRINREPKHYAPPKYHYQKRFRRYPPKSIKIYHHNKCYYYHDGFFYRLCAGGFYELFRPFIGMIVPMLPQVRVHIVHRGGFDYLLCEGVLYERIFTPYGLRYRVVGFD